MGCKMNRRMPELREGMEDGGECLENFYLVNAPEDRKVNFWQRVEGEGQQLK